MLSIMRGMTSLGPGVNRWEYTAMSQDTKRDFAWPIMSSIHKGYGSGNIIKDMRQRGKPLVRKLAVVEVERLMGFPDGYTEGVSTTRRLKALGNAVIPAMVAYAAGFSCHE